MLLWFMFQYFITCFRKSQENTPASKSAVQISQEKNTKLGWGSCYHKTSLNNSKAVRERIQVPFYMCVGMYSPSHGVNSGVYELKNKAVH